MRNLTVESDSSNSKQHNSLSVPVELIIESRDNFAERPISFEILLEIDEVSHAMEFCSQIAQTALRVVHMTYRENGAIFLRLHDNPSTPPQELELLFANSPQVSILRWTNIIGNRS